MVLRLVGPSGELADASDIQPGETVRWTCAFVNNMPDGAFDSTERQFSELLVAASNDDIIDLRRYAMAGVPRSERTAPRIAREYEDVAAIRDNPPDLLIVTGSNPLELHIEDEPYWDDLTALLSWASDNVSSMVLSCLSAHAALSLFDGIDRLHLATKCTGVFAQQVDATHPLGVGLEHEIFLPHSRTNTVALEALLEAGYQVPIYSNEVGWSVATREIKGAQMVLIQGHPEYDPSSLLREYHRDVGRYVRHERDEIPRLPYHCVTSEDWPQLEHLHEEVISGHRDPSLVEQYPFDEVGERAPWRWRVMAKQLYANWLASVAKRRE